MDWSDWEQRPSVVGPAATGGGGAGRARPQAATDPARRRTTAIALGHTRCLEEQQRSARGIDCLCVRQRLGGTAPCQPASEWLGVALPLPLAGLRRP